MKNLPWRRHRAAYPLQGELQPRHTDLDRWQHLNNAALMAMHGETCQRWLQSVFGEGVWREAQPELCMQASATDFLAESHYPAPLATGARLLSVDQTGFVLGTALFQQGHCVGLHQATLAAWGDGQVLPLPAGVAHALQAAADAQPSVPASAVAPRSESTPAPAPARAHFAWQVPLASRFADSDARGQTSDFCLARLAEQCRVQFLTQVFGPHRQASPTGFMVAHVGLQRLQRAPPPTQWQAGCGVARLGERSLALHGALFDGEVCQATWQSVMVVIDHASRRSTVMPAESRTLLAPHQLPSAAAPAPQ